MVSQSAASENGNNKLVKSVEVTGLTYAEVVQLQLRCQGPEELAEGGAVSRIAADSGSSVGAAPGKSGHVLDSVQDNDKASKVKNGSGADKGIVAEGVATTQKGNMVNEGDETLSGRSGALDGPEVNTFKKKDMKGPSVKHSGGTDVTSVAERVTMAQEGNMDKEAEQASSRPMDAIHGVEVNTFKKKDKKGPSVKQSGGTEDTMAREGNTDKEAEQASSRRIDAMDGAEVNTTDKNAPSVKQSGGTEETSVVERVMMTRDGNTDKEAEQPTSRRMDAMDGVEASPSKKKDLMRENVEHGGGAEDGVIGGQVTSAMDVDTAKERVEASHCKNKDKKAASVKQGSGTMQGISAGKVRLISEVNAAKNTVEARMQHEEMDDIEHRLLDAGMCGDSIGSRSDLDFHANRAFKAMLFGIFLTLSTLALAQLGGVFASLRGAAIVESVGGDAVLLDARLGFDEGRINSIKTDAAHDGDGIRKAGERRIVSGAETLTVATTLGLGEKSVTSYWPDSAIGTMASNIAPMHIANTAALGNFAASPRYLSASSASDEVVHTDSDPHPNFFLRTMNQAYQRVTALVTHKHSGSVMQISLPSWGGGFCTRKFDNPVGDYEYTCVPSSGSLAFGPDPATAVRAVLTQVSVVTIANASGHRAVAPALQRTTGMAVVFNFSVSSREQLDSRHAVFTQKHQHPGLCKGCNLAEVRRTRGEIENELLLLDGGWCPMEPMASNIEVVVPLGSAKGERTWPCTETAHVFLGRPPPPLPYLPHDMLFHDGAFFIVDFGHDRILRLLPEGREASVYFGGTQGNGLDQLNCSQSMMVHEGTFFIVDTGNHRILRLVPGEREASVYFGGARGDGPDQLDFPCTMFFHVGEPLSEDAFFIVDSGNHRILRLVPGEKEASNFFRHAPLRGLRSPSSMIFHDGAFFIVDSGNNQILRLGLGEREPSVYFGGTQGNGLDQLHFPTRMLFHAGAFFIVDSYNQRILRLVPGEKNASMYLRQLQKPVSMFYNEGDGAFFVVDSGTVFPKGRIWRLLPGETEAKVYFGLNSNHELYHPRSMLFHAGAFFIVDFGNHRILKLAPGEGEASVYFGGTQDNGLDLPFLPSSMLLHDGAFFIADQKNHSILRLVPGEKEASVYFGGTKGNGLDQLDRPKFMLFHDGALFIVDFGNHRILRLVAGDKDASLYFGGTHGTRLDQLYHPMSLLFHAGTFFVVDCGNHRILRLVPGEQEASVYFGGTQGSGLDQLSYPFSMLVHEGTFLIVDSGNNRILRLVPGEEEASVYFGGNDRGGRHQLFNPFSMLVHEGVFFIVDQGNHRILRLMPGEKEASMYFGNDNSHGCDYFWLPTSMLFHDGAFFILEKGHGRILRFVPGEKGVSIVSQSIAEPSLWQPTSMIFHDGAFFIVDSGNSRIVRLVPGEEGSLYFGGIQGKGLTQLYNPSSMLVHEGEFLIIDFGNDRILRLVSGEQEASLYFGGIKGNGLDQLNGPTTMLFQDGAFFIVDQRNHRILRLEPGEKEASLYFGGTQGSELDQLSFPKSMLFHDGAFFIVDYGNDRILKHLLSATSATVFMGKGCDCCTVELLRPRFIVWHDGNFYIVSNGRIFVHAPEATEAEDSPKSFGELLQNCSHAWISGSRGRSVVQLNCSLAAPTVKESMTRHSQVEFSSFTFPDAAMGARLVPLRMSTTFIILPDVKLLERRQARFQSLLLILLGVVVAAHMWGTPLAHAAAAFLAAVALYIGSPIKLVSFPHLHGAAWTARPAVAAAVLLPWGVAPAYVYWDSPDQWSRDELVDRTCSTGMRWEFHVFTLLCAIISISLWMLFMRPDERTYEQMAKGYALMADSPHEAEGDPTNDERPASALPGILRFLKLPPPADRQFLLPHMLRKWLPRSNGRDSMRLWPKPVVVVRLSLLLGWLYGSVVDQYLDLNVVIIGQACGFKYTDMQVVVLLAALLLQNVGGALHILCRESRDSAWKAALCLFMAPPMELLGLRSTGNYLVVVRVVFEDLPQLVFHVMFTYMVRFDSLVLFNIFMSGGFLLFHMYTLLRRARTSLSAHTRAPSTRFLLAE